ncbi:hypothetical protein D210916BOD24_01520 [Alteromonas sp. D210916BOD_24]|uniref:hypothetical protein n=1 Tax=Alteromonas sp. D210916BOD_24 TaxID=3157618 RepID=UPI00399D0633
MLNALVAKQKGIDMISSTQEPLSNQQFVSGQRPPKPPQTELNQQQTETVQSILANYDADSLTGDDAKAIIEAFKEAGIQPGESLESVMEQAGFDAKQLGELAGLEKGMPQRPLPPTATFETTV